MDKEKQYPWNYGTGGIEKEKYEAKLNCYFLLLSVNEILFAADAGFFLAIL